MRNENKETLEFLTNVNMMTTFKIFTGYLIEEKLSTKVHYILRKAVTANDNNDVEEATETIRDLVKWVRKERIRVSHSTYLSMLAVDEYLGNPAPEY